MATDVNSPTNHSHPRPLVAGRRFVLAAAAVVLSLVLCSRSIAGTTASGALVSAATVVPEPASAWIPDPLDPPAEARKAQPPRADRKSLLLELDPVAIPAPAPQPVAPISADPGADVIPLPAPFIGGAAILAFLIGARCWRR